MQLLHFVHGMITNSIQRRQVEKNKSCKLFKHLRSVDVNVEIQGMHIQIVGEIQFNDVHVYNWIAKVVFFEKVSR